MKEIQLTQGKVALVDDADFDYLMQWKWCAGKDPNGSWYAVRNQSIKMHRSILQHVKGRIDHKDRDGLNNQRENLRACTLSQNMQNRKLNIDNKSGLKGVQWHPDAQKWRARITVKGKTFGLGFFIRAIDAAVAYDEAAQQHFGEFACLNFSYDPACYI